MSNDYAHTLLIAGGDADPNLRTLESAATRKGLRVHSLLIGKDSHPSVVWDVNTGQCLINGEELSCDAAFIRYDVFTALQDGQPSSQHRALSWHTALTGWLAAHAEIRVFNRRSLNFITNKPLMLHLAQSAGLAIPQSLVTNDLNYLEQYEEEKALIVKPVNGGGYCQELGEVVKQTATREGRTASPAIIQQRLVQPEIRIYAIGRRYFAFSVISAELDYRAATDCRLEFLGEASDKLTDSFGRLLDSIGLDFAAADFKTCAQSGRLLFLEVNTAPMFQAFDKASEGQLCDAMLLYLAGENLSDGGSS